MIATKLIGWCLLSYGLMNIMVFGSIFQWMRDFFSTYYSWPFSVFRKLGEIISGILGCPMCFGFHGGWVISLLLWSPTNELFMTSTNYSWFFDGILSSGVVWLINDIAEYLENKTNK